MRSLGEVNGVRYEIFDMNSIHDMVFMVTEAFTQYDPLAVAQGFSHEEFADFVKLLGPKAEQEELTVIARDKETNEIAGAIITEDFVSPPAQGIENVSDKFGPIFALLNELDEQYRQNRNIGLGECLHIFMIAVTQNRKGRKIAQNLVRMCLQHGSKKGYKTAVTEATGLISQHIFRKHGFKDIHEIQYKTYTYRGKQVFKSIDGPTGTILMDKVPVF